MGLQRQPGHGPARVAGLALAALRKVKSEAKTSQRTPILSVAVTAEPAVADAIESVRTDLIEAAKVTGPFEVARTPASADSSVSPVSVTTVELDPDRPREPTLVSWAVDPGDQGVTFPNWDLRPAFEGVALVPIDLSRPEGP